MVGKKPKLKNGSPVSPKSSPVSSGDSTPLSPPPLMSANSSSSTGSGVRVSSPLSPSSSPRNIPTPLSEPSLDLGNLHSLQVPTYSEPSLQSQLFSRSRANSTSTMRPGVDAETSLSSSPGSAQSITVAGLGRKEGNALEVERSTKRQSFVETPPEPGSRETPLPPPPPQLSFLRGRGISPSPRRHARQLSPVSPGGAHTPAAVPSGEQSRGFGLTFHQRTSSTSLIRTRPWRTLEDDEEDMITHKHVPAEQVEAWKSTRDRVAEATASVLGTIKLVAHEALLQSVPILKFAPVPGLEIAAEALLEVWDSLQTVDTNRLQCLRLTQRCADILLSIREEVQEAGDQVGAELEAPIQKLTETYRQVNAFLIKQAHRPFLKRYLKREEIQRSIVGCDSALTDSLSLFNISIQIRILKQLQSAERERIAEIEMLRKTMIESRAAGLNPAVLAGARTISILADVEEADVEDDEELEDEDGHPGHSPPQYEAHPSIFHFDDDGHAAGQPIHPSDSPISPRSVSGGTTTSAPPANAADDPLLHKLTPKQVRSRLRRLYARQNEFDASRDAGDLRQLMRAALQRSSDVEMIEVLQVGRDEMPEAIKALQRALERESDREAAEADAVGVTATAEAEAGAVTVGQQQPGQAVQDYRHSASSSVGTAATATGSEASTNSTQRTFARPRDLVRRLTSGSTGGGTGAGATPAAGATTLVGSPGSHTIASDATIGGDSAGTTTATLLRDTLDQEFMESGIEALRRMSMSHAATGLGGAAPDLNLPSWTITRYEVDTEQKVGMGFFSDVYKGVWRNHVVAIKQLAEWTTSRQLFMNEIEIWRTLDHPNVLKLYGASSTTADPPWFFVSPYCKNGSLVTYLQHRRDGREVDLLKAMHEVAKGMWYLHGKGVLHGDLKAANVLVDDRGHCLVSDFGQSKIKSEAYRLSGRAPPHGTLRWQAPELLDGTDIRLTVECDVYSFAITCIEILNMGELPWKMLDDETVLRLVTKQDKRPPIPLTSISSKALTLLVQRCWHKDPFQRPHFSEIQRDLEFMRRSSGTYHEDSPRVQPIEIDDEQPSKRPSPDIRPTIPLPPVSPTDNHQGQNGSKSPGADPSFATAQSSLSQTSPRGMVPEIETHNTITTIPEINTPSMTASISSLFTSAPDDTSESAERQSYSGYESPRPVSKDILDRRDEQRYRLRLLLSMPQNSFHKSLTLPLWSPESLIQVGAVGFLRKPEGEFVTLFNALDPSKSSEGTVRGMPSIYGYGRVSTSQQQTSKRTAFQMGMDTIQGIFRIHPPSRRYSYPLRRGHKAAYLVTESTVYNYMESVDAAKKWFKGNVKDVLKLFGTKHRIQREDIFLVIGKLDTSDYGLFVSHKHPDGQVHFDVASPAKTGEGWGKFSVDTGEAVAGPNWEDDQDGGQTKPDFTKKVSNVGQPKRTVLLARLRFKPDSDEPTSL